MEPRLLIEVITNGPFMENCIILADAQTRQGILVDPGDEEERIARRVHELDLQLTEIVATHGHVDHTAAVAPLKRRLGLPFAIHPADREWLERLPHQAALFGLPPCEVPEVDRELSAGDEVAVGQLTARVLHTPGHSAGGICLLLQEQETVIVGDTLFAGSIGRTDLPGGAMETLLASIRRELLALDDAVQVYSGHGPKTTVGQERAHNPFLRPGGLGSLGL